MTRGRFGVVAALAMAVSCGSPETAVEPPDVELRAEGSSAELTLTIRESRIPVTDPLRVSLTVTVDESRQVEFPETLGSPEEFAAGASDVSDPRLLDDGRVLYERTYELEAFLPGDYELGAVEIRHWPKEDQQAVEILTVDGASITVDSVLTVGEEEAELRDIRDPVSPPLPWGLFGLAGLAALALGALAYWFWKRRRPQEASETAAPLPPPHVAALHALDRLLAEGLVERGELKLFYGLMSNILRRYVEDRFGIHAPERTTEEFLYELRGGTVLGPAHQGLLKDFLRHSDLVKFAEMRPNPEDIDRSVSLCRQFIEETVPRGVEAMETVE